MKNVHLWSKISAAMERKLKIKKSHDECAKEYAKLLKKHKEGLDHNKKSGNNKVDVPYSEEFHELTFNDDSIEPEFVISAKKCKYFQK